MYVYIYIYTYNNKLYMNYNREFKDAVFEDVVVDNDRCYLILYLDFT